ncbi:MAG: lactate racemase domain-containing protein [Sphaerochaetaceae bacterium]
MDIANPFGKAYSALELPHNTYVVHMEEPDLVADPAKAIAEALEHPIASRPLSVIAREKLVQRKAKDGQWATAIVVVSDNTRPVPYTGEEGLLLPIVSTLLETGFRIQDILILIATGTHRAMTSQEITRMIDQRILDMGITVVNHDCHDQSMLTYLGNTQRGTEVHIDTRYVQADLKIATGLVESHFMAGASGGRKAICPGLIGEKSTFVFHGAALMADAKSCNLSFEENPVHAEAVEVACMAGIDFLVNVTLDHAFHTTGIFTGDFIKAHEAAVAHIAKSVRVVCPASDVVVTHGGFVGINHYQIAKCAVASLGILKKDGYLVIIADTTDTSHVVGGINYRTTLALLKLVGAKAFLQLITSPDWTFIPEQWQVQQWAKVFERIPQDHLLFYSPTMDEIWWPGLPGLNIRNLLPKEEQAIPSRDCFRLAIKGALDSIAQRSGHKLEELSISWVDDGPYVVPVTQEPLV